MRPVFSKELRTLFSRREQVIAGSLAFSSPAWIYVVMQEGVRTLHSGFSGQPVVERRVLVCADPASPYLQIWSSGPCKA